MEKKEFLDALRSYLIGEVPTGEIETNIEYYNNYISENADSPEEERQCIQGIGDPRLIARTIITSFEMSHENNEGTQKRVYNTYTETNGNENTNQEDIKDTVLKMIPLRYKVIGIVSTIAILVILFYVAKAFLFIFAKLFLPVLFIMLLVVLFNKLFNR